MLERREAHPEPLLVPAQVGFAMIGVRLTKGWELVREGRIAARKIGSRTMIETASLRAFVASLPPARAPEPEPSKAA